MPLKDPDEARAYNREYQRKRRAANPDEQREAQKRYLERHHEKVRQRRRDAYMRDAEVLRARAKEKYDPARHHKYYLANKERINARVKAYRAANPEAAKARNQAWWLNNQERRRELGRLWRAANKDRIEAKRLARYWALKKEVWSHYGGLACVCCGTDDLKFLTIDHINGGGRKHRLDIRAAGRQTVYHWLKENNYPAGYQVLCMNCNFAKGMYGHCPHEGMNTKP